jgi:hypothetical protein
VAGDARPDVAVGEDEVPTLARSGVPGCIALSVPLPQLVAARTTRQWNIRALWDLVLASASSSVLVATSGRPDATNALGIWGNVKQSS